MCTSTICSHPPGLRRLLSSRTYVSQRPLLIPSLRKRLLMRWNVSGRRSESWLVRNEAFRFHLFLTKKSGRSSSSSSSSSSLESSPLPWPVNMSMPTTYYASSALASIPHQALLCAAARHRNIQATGRHVPKRLDKHQGCHLSKPLSGIHTPGSVAHQFHSIAVEAGLDDPEAGGRCRSLR